MPISPSDKLTRHRFRLYLHLEYVICADGRLP